jgi:hypothetical protein
LENDFIVEIFIFFQIFILTSIAVSVFQAGPVGMKNIPMLSLMIAVCLKPKFEI